MPTMSIVVVTTTRISRKLNGKIYGKKGQQLILKYRKMKYMPKKFIPFKFLHDPMRKL